MAMLLDTPATTRWTFGKSQTRLQHARCSHKNFVAGQPRGSVGRLSYRTPSQFNYASRHSAIQVKAAHREAVKPAPAPAKEDKPKGVELKWQPGTPEPLGPSADPTGKGVNFALYSEHASAVALEIYNDEDNSVREFNLDPSKYKTGHVWHTLIEGLPLSGVLYGYKVQGQGGWETGGRWYNDDLLLDPYAPLISGRRHFGVRDEVEEFEEKEGSLFWGTFDFESPAFEWGADYQRPNLPPQDLIVYEMPIRSFTADPSSGVGDAKQGTFAGVAEKIPHLVELGINAVELLPVFEYDELEFQRIPNPRDHMVNIWGYSHINFFAPMSRYAADGAGPVAAAKEFKQMVKQLHKAGIEVILDVVYNHTAEGGDDDPYVLSFRGIDNETYYMLNPNHKAHLLNYSGCGNTVSANHPAVKQMIMDSCRRWVEEYHVDGFRFDLASCLCRDSKGTPIEAPPLIRDLAKDPVLSKVKLIAEPWDCGGLYQVGGFPNWDVWGEWNGKYRDDVRRFIKGDAGVKSAFATRISGSADLYHVNNRKPHQGINFIIAHDGFTLYDLVAYNDKHNDANGEQNRDGSNDNFSWNCGQEGETDDAGVNALRQRQMRNMMLALMVSQGTPMVLMGDEYAQTRNGNNNWYGHDTKMTRFEWDQLEKVKDTFFRFYSEIIKFRKGHPLLGRTDFLRQNDITWHEDNWENTDSRYLAFTLHDLGQGGGDLYVAFNAHTFAIDAHLPSAPEGKTWRRVVDTNLQPPKDITPGGNKGVESVYSVQPFSSILLVAK